MTKDIARITKIHDRIRLMEKTYTELVALLKQANFNKHTIASTPYMLYAVERMLHILIEATIDIATHTAKYLKLGNAHTYRESLEVLLENKILPKEFYDRFSKITGLRNLLVHEYIKIDPNLLLENLINNYMDFKKFIEYIKKAVEL